MYFGDHCLCPESLRIKSQVKEEPTPSKVKDEPMPSQEDDEALARKLQEELNKTNDRAPSPVPFPSCKIAHSLFNFYLTITFLVTQNDDDDDELLNRSYLESASGSRYVVGSFAPPPTPVTPNKRPLSQSCQLPTPRA